MSDVSGIAGVRLPGRGRVLFCRTGDLSVRHDEWVAVRTRWGDEAGIIAIVPEQVAYATDDEPESDAIRTLSRREIDVAVEHAERARGLMPDLTSAVDTLSADLALYGLRFTLDGVLAIASLAVDAEQDMNVLSESLTRHLAMRLIIEPLPPGSHQYGAMGRLRPRYRSLDEIVDNRFDRPSDGHAFAPEGLPRLGRPVRTSRGTGSLRSISLRRNTALVALESGEEVTVSVADLADPETQ